MGKEIWNKVCEIRMTNNPERTSNYKPMHEAVLRIEVSTAYTKVGVLGVASKLLVLS